ncbi:MAG: putative glycoside hydrolase [Roseiflexaceae bacterium]
MSIRVYLHRLPIVALGVALAAILAACGAPPIAINGTITDAYTGKPIPAAKLTLGGSMITTDASGKYQFPRWAEEDTLQIVASGYESFSVALGTQPQIVKPTPPAVTLDAAIRPNTLSGRVIDTYTGKPLAGAQIKAGATLSATTGADGRYTLTGVPESFTLAVAAPDHEPFSQSLKRTTSFDTELRSNVLMGTITDSYTDQPLAGAIVQAGKATATTAADGRYRIENVPADATVMISADGYAELTQPLEQTTALDAPLRPDVLRGTLVDAATGKPIQNATIIATPNLNSTDVAFARIDNRADGVFRLDGIPEQGYIQVLAPGYRKTTFELKPGSVPAKIELEPFQAKALYITAAVAAGGPKLVDEYLDLIDHTELNTLVVDLKSDLRDDLGLVYYDSQVPIVKELGTSRDYVDMKALLAETKKRGIYTIARVQLFSHDNALADAKPEWGIQDPKTGKVYADYPGPGIRYAYLDPWNRNVWDYNIQLGVEAALMGFDEINYDYVRFPDWYGDLSTYNQDLGFSQPTDPVNAKDAMFNNIAEFAKQAHQAINGAGAYLSVDLFGRVMLEPSMPIGQDIKRIGPNVDFVCPMPYPSLWWPGYLDLDNPTAHPYEVILGTLKNGKPLFEDIYGRVRPWLQDHTDPWQGNRVVEYGPTEVRAQIKAVDDYGEAAGWMLYDSANAYRGAFNGAVKPEK